MSEMVCEFVMLCLVYKLVYCLILVNCFKYLWL